MSTEELARALRDRIEEGGPLSFFDFMEAALYHPEHGYYTGNAPGPGSDFRTAPSLTPRFGALVGSWLAGAFRALGSPEEFRVVEIGPGRGDLAAGALASVTDDLASALTWVLVERSPGVRSVQEERLRGLRVEWASGLDALGAADGCVVANEVVDNFPVHLLEVAGGGLVEIGVGVEGDAFIEVPMEPGDRLVRLASDALPHLSEGDRLEVRPQVDAWCAGAHQVLGRGWLLVIDYGDLRPDIWTANPQGTLTGYREERMIDDLLSTPGGCDITAHVDFTHLAEVARSAGFEVPAPITQGDLLRSAGIDAAAGELRADRELAFAEGRYEDAAAAMAEQSRLTMLNDAWAMGDLPALLGAKDAPVLPPWK